MNEENRYEWQSSGGCTRCDAMDNRYSKTPLNRPHPNCNCTIVDRYAQNTDCDESDVRYEIQHAGNSHNSSTDPGDELEMYFDYLITCWGNKGQIGGQVTVKMTYGKLESMDLDDFFEEAFIKAMKMVDDIAAEKCPPCERPLVA